MDIQDIKEKLLLLGITAGLFLPIRMIFMTYVTEHWLGSFGLVTVFGLSFIYLIKKNKLGHVGRIFERQMRKTIGGKAGKYVIAFSIVFLIYFGTSIFLMDRGNSVYYDDKEILFLIFQNDQQLKLENFPIEQLEGPIPLATNLEGLFWLSNFEYALSISLALMDDVSDGWIGNLIAIVFIEQLEVLGILYLFRRKYKTTVHIEMY